MLESLSNKAKRRRNYKITQKKWARNPGVCVRELIGTNIERTNVPPKEMISFWTTKITTTTRGPDNIHRKDLRSLDPRILAIILNLLKLCDRLPDRMLESRTVLTPKKINTKEPGDFRPLSISSVLLRCLHKILARIVDKLIPINDKQTAFRPVDGCSINTYLVDMALRYHRTNQKSLYVATTDIAKAYDSITHESLRDTMIHYGFPPGMIHHIMATYKHGWTRLICCRAHSTR